MKRLFLSVSIIGLLTLSLCNNVFAFKEIGDYGVDITYALDSFDTYKVRTSSNIVTDDSRFSQKYDTIDFKDVYDGKYNIDTLKTEGYYTMAVEITLDVKKIDDGYQYIFIYDDTRSDTFLTGCQFECGKSYRNMTFYFEVSIFNIKENDFVIRYGASGKFSDDWENKNLNIQVGFSKEAVKTTNIWYIKWLNDNHTKYQYEKLTDAS